MEPRISRSYVCIIAALFLSPLISNMIFCAHPSQKRPVTKKATSPAKPKSTHARQPKKKLTILMYLEGDNNLEPYVDFNRKQLEKEGVPDDINMLLFMCTHRLNETKLATKAVVIKNKTKILEKIQGVDGGDKKAFLNACKWAVTDFPSDDLMIIPWDHGNGPMNRSNQAPYVRGICYDSTTGNFLSDTDLREVFATISKDYLHGEKITYVGFDACLMGAIEIADAIQPSVKYMISSEHSIPAIGWPYHYIMKAYKKGKKSADTFARAIVEAYRNYYDPLIPDYTLSLVDLEKLDPLKKNINSFTTVLNELLLKQQGKSVTNALRNASTQTTRFDEPSYADLYDWYSNVSKNAPRMSCVRASDTKRLLQHLIKIASDGLVLIDRFVLEHVQGTSFSRSHGTLIYLPEQYIDESYTTCYWAKTTSWPTFLHTYLAKK